MFKISKIKYENWQNYEWCGISNGRTKPKFANFRNQIMAFQIEKKFQKFHKFYNFENHRISIIDKVKKKYQISEIVECRKLASFQNLTICKTIKISRISNLMVNYHIFCECSNNSNRRIYKK